MLEKQIAGLGISFLRFDLFENLIEMDEYNPNKYLANLNTIYNSLEQSEKDALQSTLQNNNLSETGNTRFQEAFKEFIDRFGHISTNSNNFMAVPWREDLQSVIDMIREYKAVERDAENHIRFDDLPFKKLKQPFFRFFYRRARQFNLFQEKVSSKYIYGYGLFRPYILQLAEEFVKLGWLNNDNDIFYLTWEEIKQAISLSDASGFSENIKDTKRKNELISRYNPARGDLW